MRFTFHVLPDVGHTWIHFETPSIPSTVVERRWPEPFVIHHPGSIDEMRRIGKQLAFSDDHHGLVLQAHALATQAWCQILEHGQSEASLTDSSTSSRLDAVLTYIENSLAHPLAIADLAKLAGVGPEQLTRLFRAEFRTSPGQFLLERRVRRVADLLLSTNLSLDVIAKASGLANRRYCSRMFTARMGIPPIRYRSAYSNSR
jgi:transcriptional regulator GlxA family with amidase domain